MKRALLMLAAMALAACAPDLRDDFPFDGQVNDGPLVTVTVNADGSRTALVDATNRGSQVYVDLDGEKEMKADEAFSTNGWDLAFKRTAISMNGGSGNPDGKVEVAVLHDVDFASLTQAPATGYLQDGTKTVFNSGDDEWYFYDISVHKVVTRTDLLYVVHSSDGAYFKLKMLSYYDDAGTAARLSFLFQTLEAP